MTAGGPADRFVLRGLPPYPRLEYALAGPDCARQAGKDFADLCERDSELPGPTQTGAEGPSSRLVERGSLP